MMEPDAETSFLSAATRQRLEALGRSLLALHKVLLEGERHSYERLYGRVGSGGELLQLIIHHPWFAWLRSISSLVVLIDEMAEKATAESEEPANEQDAAALFEQVRALLRPTEGNNGGDAAFQKRYRQALQEDPAIILAHAAVIRLLPPLPERKSQ